MEWSLMFNFDLGIGDIVSAGINSWQNEKDRKFAQEQAAVQERQWREAFEAQKQQYSQNYQEAVRQYEENMAWQKNLATNSNQMRVADLKRAGLNPVLAAGSGTISQPPVHSNPSGMVNPGHSSPVSHRSNSVSINARISQNALVDQQRRLMEQQERLGDAQIANVNADSHVKEAQAESLGVGTEHTRGTEARQSELHPYALEQARRNNSISAAQYSGMLMDNTRKQHDISRFDMEDLIRNQDLTLKRLESQKFEYDFRRYGLDLAKSDVEKTILQYQRDIYLETGYDPKDSSDPAQISRYVRNTFPGMSSTDRTKLTSLIAGSGVLLHEAERAYSTFKPKKQTIFNFGGR